MVTNLVEYVSAPLAVEERCDVFSPSVLWYCERGLSYFGRWRWVKRRCIKKLCACLIREKKLQPFALQLVKGKEPLAFMSEQGGMVLSKGCFTKISAEQLFTIVLHEVAHLWMKDQAFYPTLKEIDREFRGRYKHLPNYRLFSPIETYADYFALGITETLCAQAKGARQQRSLRQMCEKQKKQVETCLQNIRSVSDENA